MTMPRHIYFTTGVCYHIQYSVVKVTKTETKGFSMKTNETEITVLAGLIASSV